VVQRKPFKVYLYNYYPNDGAEVLYVTGERDGKALVNPNKFPYVNLNLDPYGSLLRDNQHHTIFSSGFDDLANILRHLKKKFGADANKFIHYDGKITWNGRSCHVIKMENPGWGTVNYTVQAGEDLNKIARKHMVSEYMIMEMNSNIKSYDGVKAGQVIKIPSEYGKKAIFYIDTQMLLPIRTEVYDHLGLYERYEFFDVVVNPSLPADTFSSSNKNYKF
jgi:LysM repeat protein